MAYLVEKITKSFSKSHKFAPPFLSFQSNVSNCLNPLLLDPKPRSKIPSFSSIRQLFHAIPIIHRAFANLVVDIDYPITEWDAYLIDEFLKYTFNLLQLLNSISSSLSHLAHARLLLSYSLSKRGTSPLKFMKPRRMSLNLKTEGCEKGKGSAASCFSGKGLVTHQALMIMEGIGFEICGVVISGLNGDVKACVENEKPARKMAKEVEEVNDLVGMLLSAIYDGESVGEGGEDETRRRLEVLEMEMDGFGKEVDGFFSEVFNGRSRVLDNFRHMKK